MNALLNGELYTYQEIQTVQNRGFRFGDGCFETMLVKSGVCPLLTQHENRLKKSLGVLGMEWPAHLQLEAQIRQLAINSPEWQRVRLWVWRAGGGVYTPETTATQSMLAAQPAQAPGIVVRHQVEVSEEVVLTPSRWSFVKTISALHYVMAGMEKQQKKADELILLNHLGEVAEATAANLFFKKRNRWFTPALNTGCVAGVMRAWIMQQMLQKGEPVYEVNAQSEELQRVEKLVCTNVTGLQPIAQLQGKQYNTDVDELWSLMPLAYKA